MTSYAHDAEVVVYNYTARSTEDLILNPLLAANPFAANPLNTTRISLRDAVINIQCSKTKSSPQGSFSLILKPTKEWTKILVPGSWCAIYMSDRPLTTQDINNGAKLNPLTGTVYAPLKMTGMIMGIRVNKSRDANGAYTLTYTVTGYDYGYLFTSSIYINQVLQAGIAKGDYVATFEDLTFPKDGAVYGNPAINLQRVLKAWSKISKLGLPIGLGPEIKPPAINCKIPDPIKSLFQGKGNAVLELVRTAIGVDQRSSKVFLVGGPGQEEAQSPSFKFQLIGEKRFMVYELITNNTLWGMINQYLNPILNEAYCDLHVVIDANSTNPLSALPRVVPMMIARQIPFNTSLFKPIWQNTAIKDLNPNLKQPFEVTYLTDLPKNKIPKEKVISYDLGYSEYERVNFIECTGFSIDTDNVAKNQGQFNSLNKPSYEERSINRLGLRAKIFSSADYGVALSGLDTAGAWRPLLQDWWFNSHKYVNGTIECIGLLEHIALGENVELDEEELLGHIEGYTHSFSVSPDGLRTFRTSIEFVKGIKSNSTSTKFKYIYGDEAFGGDFGVNIPGVGAAAQESSSFEDDVKQRVTSIKTKPPLGGS